MINLNFTGKCPFCNEKIIGKWSSTVNANYSCLKCKTRFKYNIHLSKYTDLERAYIQHGFITNILNFKDNQLIIDIWKPTKLTLPDFNSLEEIIQIISALLLFS
jgi:DNA-directed RNA polymerase subunit RPC12/RpoP